MFGKSGFDSTYEGLKLRKIASAVALESGFDSTYEGLKHGGEVLIHDGGQVSTVPMRA